MDEKKVQKFKQRLTEEYQKLIRSINRNRLAEEEITLENTEDEGDLATISHNKELLYNLHESDFQRLKSHSGSVEANGPRRIRRMPALRRRYQREAPYGCAVGDAVHPVSGRSREGRRFLTPRRCRQIRRR